MNDSPPYIFAKYKREPPRSAHTRLTLLSEGSDTYFSPPHLIDCLCVIGKGEDHPSWQVDGKTWWQRSGTRILLSTCYSPADRDPVTDSICRYGSKGLRFSAHNTNVHVRTSRKDKHWLCCSPAASSQDQTAEGLQRQQQASGRSF